MSFWIWSTLFIDGMIWNAHCQIYFLDLQVWYTVISALVGGLDGARMGLGEVGNDSISVWIICYVCIGHQSSSTRSWFRCSWVEKICSCALYILWVCVRIDWNYWSLRQLSRTYSSHELWSRGQFVWFTRCVTVSDTKSNGRSRLQSSIYISILR